MPFDVMRDNRLSSLERTISHSVALVAEMNWLARLDRSSDRYDPALAGLKDAATCAKIGLYFSVKVVGAIQISRYMTVPIGMAYCAT